MRNSTLSDQSRQPSALADRYQGTDRWQSVLADINTGRLPATSQIFPCWSVRLRKKDGKLYCTCPDRLACKDQGKHPLTRHGLKDASGHPKVIDRWREKYPTANISLRTGKESGVDVLDVDRDKGGFDSLRRLVNNYGDIPCTLIAKTGSGRRHFYFQHRAGLRNQASRLRGYPGLDIRTDGGYVLVPPSNHISGGSYSWLMAEPIAPWPEWLFTLFLPPPPRPKAPPYHGEPTGYVPERLLRFARKGADAGGRNTWGFWMACRLVEQVGDCETAREVLDLFARNCRPPLEDDLDRIWQSALKTTTYSPDFVIIRLVDKDTGLISYRRVRRVLPA